MNFRDVDALIKGSEIKKAVWSFIKKGDPIKMSDIKRKTGYQDSNLSVAMKFLVDNGIAERFVFNSREVRGTYILSPNMERY